MIERSIRRIMRRIDQDYERLVATEAAFVDARASATARLICIAQTGIEIEIHPHSKDAMTIDLANIAEQHDLTPDDIQAILLRHEPSLGEW
jgi:hypothetical protein